MLRVILPTGRMVNVDEVRLLCEGTMYVGGRRVSMVNEPIDTSYQPSVIKLFLSKPNPFESDTYFIGNMPSTILNQVVDELLTKGYYNFSRFTYQEVDNITDIVMDGGKTAMYCCSGLAMRELCATPEGLFIGPKVVNNGVSIVEEPFDFSDYRDETENNVEYEEYDEYDEYNED